ncbi:MAG: helix-turn-helix transcriptional regulator [Eggerthellaceae bacterium]|nr:helix-turn-helix transcriptional regulator [Eggerthellaceae bacterium]
MNNVKAVVWGGLGFSLYRTAATFLYNTGMGATFDATGFVSDIRFVFAMNACACLTAVVLLIALRGGKLGAAGNLQWPALAIVAVGLLVGAYGRVLGLSAQAGAFVSAVACGIALMLLCAVWLDLLTRQKDATCMLRQLAVGYVLYTAASMLFEVLPGGIGGAVSLLLLCCSSVCVVMLGRQLDAAGQGVSIPRNADGRSGVVASICFFVLVGVVGIMHTSVLGSSFQSIVTVNMWATRVVALVVFLVLVYLMGQHVAPNVVFRTLFPALILVLTVMPFLDDTLGPVTGAIAITCYEICGMVYFLFLVREGRRLNLSGVFLSCVYMLGSSGFLLVGLAIGLCLQTLSAGFGLSLLTLLAFVSIYPLALALFLTGRGSFGRRFAEDTASEGEGVAEPAVPAVSSVADAAQILGERYGLTNREREILEYLAHGRSVRYIAETLVISENTAWTHAKRIYAKTGAHGKQELMTMVDAELGAGRAGVQR